MQKIFKNSHKKRFVSTLIGSFFYFIGIISSLGIGQYSVYITSYFHYYNSKVNMQIGNLMMPLLTFFLSLSAPLGGLYEHKIGMHLSLLINSIFLEIIIFCFIIQKNIYLTFFIIILKGVIFGTSISIPMKNLYLYYPEKKGLLMALINSIIVIFGGILNVIGENIINPKKVTIKDGEIYYPLYIAKNYIKYYKLVLLIIPICSIISLLLIKKYDSTYINNQDQVLYNNVTENKKDSNYSKNIKSAIFNSRIWKICAIELLNLFVLGFALSTFRVYGALLSINGTVMQYSPLIFGLSTIICGPIWGYINDKSQNFKIAKRISFLFIIHSIIISIFIKSNYIYIICIFVGLILQSGLNNVILHHIMKIYGIKYSIEIGGISGISRGISNVFKGCISFLISLYYSNGKELQKIYQIIYLIGIGLNILGYYFASKEKEDPFIYQYSLENSNLDNISKSLEVKVDNSKKI